MILFSLCLKTSGSLSHNLQRCQSKNIVWWTYVTMNSQTNTFGGFRVKSSYYVHFVRWYEERWRFILLTEISVDGGWSEWSKWSRCTTTCGGGLSYSKRSCTTSPPSNEGKHCAGRRIKVRLCHLNRCKTADTKKVNLARTLSEMAADRSHIYKPW